MKKLLTFTLAALMAVLPLTGCNSSASAPPPAPTQAPVLAAPPSGADPFASVAAGNYVTGLGIVDNLSQSKSATASAAGAAVSAGTVAAVTLDSTGTITNCVIDCAQPTINFDATGKITTDLTQTLMSKDELGANYGMKSASSIGKEWYEQAYAFSQWCVGKTVAQVTGLTVKTAGGESGIPDSPDLTSSVTISVSDFQTAVANAAANAAIGSPTAGPVKTGLGIVTTLSQSKDASASAAGAAVPSSVIAVVSVDATGKVVQCKIDCLQPTINFDATGTITTDLTQAPQSKDALGAAYGMKSASSIGKEWNEQADAFSQWCLGKTITDINGLSTKTAGGESGVPDSPDLTSSVTISVGDFITAVGKAVNNAQ